MPEYTLHKNNGQIVGIAGCQPDDLANTIAANNADAAIEGSYHWNSYYVANSAPVAMPPRPSEYHTWDWSALDWVPPVADAVKSVQVAALEAAYQNAVNQDVSYTTRAGVTSTFQADATSIQNVANMLNAFSGTQAVPSGFYWVAADNTQVPFTYSDIQGLASAMGTQGFAAFANLQAKKALVAAATTADAVFAVTW